MVSELETADQCINYKIDTGADVNVLPKHLYYSLSPRPKLKQSPIKLQAYDGSQIPVLHKGKKIHVMFIVVKSKTAPIIGLNMSERLNIVQRIFKVNASDLNSDSPITAEYIPDDYFDCIGDVGTLPSTYHIESKENAQPVVVPPRKLPFAMKERVKKELDRMEKLGVTEEADKPTDWVNAMVVVEKTNGKLRICLDPRLLNQAIKRQHYRLPTATEIISEMAGAKFFSKLDASNGYWTIKVDEESSNLLTFGKAFGRYKFK